MLPMVQQKVGEEERRISSRKSRIKVNKKSRRRRSRKVGSTDRIKMSRRRRIKKRRKSRTLTRRILSGKGRAG